MSFVLASASPRRKQILEMLGIHDLRVLPALGEECPPEKGGPEELVKSLARAKALEVVSRLQQETGRPLGKDTVVIAADTIVWFRNTVFGKPGSTARAEEMLHTLSGAMHQVFTGVCIFRGTREVCQVEMSRVFFRPLDDDEIHRYVATGEPMDKAGAYGAQGIAGLFVERIDGDFFNVMGLPVCRLGNMLKELGVELL